MSGQIAKMKRELQSLDLLQLGASHAFHLRQSGRFSSVDFVLGFFLSFLSGKNSLSAWAEQISRCSGRLLSKQGLSARLSERLVNFSKALLRRAFEQQLKQRIEPLYQGDLFASFSTVLIEDSTCLNLPQGLASNFPGAYSKTTQGPAATARIQLRYALKTEQYAHVEIQSFRHNDQSYAYEVVSSIEAGSLVLRDLGYFVLGSFGAIMAKGGEILSRYRFGTSLLNPKDRSPICLSQVLQKMDKAGKNTWTQAVLVGQKEQLPLRIIAIRLPEPIVAERIRKAKKNRNQKANHQDAYFELLKWNLFLTSVSEQIWSPKQVVKAYAIRWRIEVIFKSWKSQLKLAQLFKAKQSLSYERVMIQLYLAFSWVVLFLLPWFRLFMRMTQKKKRKTLSLNKFTDWAKSRFSELLTTKKKATFWPTVQYYCAEESRKDRHSQLQIISQQFPLA